MNKKVEDMTDVEFDAYVTGWSEERVAEAHAARERLRALTGLSGPTPWSADHQTWYDKGRADGFLGQRYKDAPPTLDGVYGAGFIHGRNDAIEAKEQDQ